jgi:hypothetical protein
MANIVKVIKQSTTRQTSFMGFLFLNTAPAAADPIDLTPFQLPLT